MQSFKRTIYMKHCKIVAYRCVHCDVVIPHVDLPIDTTDISELKRWHYPWCPRVGGCGNCAMHIRQLRIKAGLTRKQLGAKTNISTTTVANIETGKRHASQHTIEKILYAL